MCFYIEKGCFKETSIKRGRKILGSRSTVRSEPERWSTSSLLVEDENKTEVQLWNIWLRYSSFLNLSEVPQVILAQFFFLPHFEYYSIGELSLHTCSALCCLENLPVAVAAVPLLCISPCILYSGNTLVTYCGKIYSRLFFPQWWDIALQTWILGSVI